MTMWLKDWWQEKLLGGSRSSGWPQIRKDHLFINPTCAVCGGTKKCEVHHKKPFNLFPELELDPDNLLTLCEQKKRGVNCHLFIGHLGDYKKFNPDVETDAKIWKIKLTI